MQNIVRLVIVGFGTIVLAGCAAGAADTAAPRPAVRPKGPVAACAGYEDFGTARAPDGRPLVQVFDSLVRVYPTRRQAPQRDATSGDDTTRSVLHGLRVTIPAEMTYGDRRSLAHRLEQAYPPALRQAGLGGAVMVLMLLDAQGTVREARLGKSSGYTEMDRAAVGLARRSRFDPAIADSCSVPFYVALPINFKVAIPRPSS